jgi:N-acetylglucosaminyldiphosphoundecaprenol N-acetyl-beta-D-mannosaminyltransferase
MPLIWASRLLTAPLKERITGVDLFQQVCERAARRGYSVYLLGGSPGAAENACACLKTRHPALKIAGWECHPYEFGNNPVENLQVQNRIRESGADILFVGLGAPKQEKWISAYGRGAGVGFAIGVGGTFSVVAGEVRRAPLWMQRSGLEWFWRVLMEPRRLWKRYLMGGIIFSRLFISEAVQLAWRRRELHSQP